MKKNLFFAIAFLASVLAFSACNNNGASLPSSAQKALNQSTVNAPALIGQAVSDAHAAFIKAGYILIDQTLVQAPAFRIQKHAANDEGSYSLYAYGIGSNVDINNEEALMAAFNKALGSGSPVIIAELAYLEEKVENVYTIIYTPLKSEVNKVYTNISQQMYDKAKSQVGSGEMMWSGAIMSTEEKRFTEFASYISAVAAAKEINAVEYNFISGAYQYQNTWYYPDQATIEDMKNDGFNTAFALGNFGISRAQ